MLSDLLIDNAQLRMRLNSVIRNGDKFSAAKKMLPGCLPGTGYDYDQVWGGLLDDSRLPPLVADEVIGSAA